MIFLSNHAGEQAAEEIAPACVGPDLAAAVAAIEEIAASPGIQSGHHIAEFVRGQSHFLAGPSMPWERGHSLAGAVRRSQG
jgi:hypothetical protein